MTSLAVSGYASIDYVVGLAGRIAGDQTTLINSRDPATWPRAGGCPTYVAGAVARAGEEAHAVTWVGDDKAGEMFRRELAAKGVGTEGVGSMDGRRSPVAVLAYQPDRSCVCLFDPVFAGEERLNTSQKEILRQASHLCVTAGPPHLAASILRHGSGQVRFYWVLKRDCHAFPLALCEELSGRADVIFCNAGERDLIGRTGRGAIIVRTGGEGGIAIEAADRVETVEVQRLEIADATGAGDTLAGGFIAAEMASNAGPVEALRNGIESAQALLASRMTGSAP